MEAGAFAPHKQRPVKIMHFLAFKSSGCCNYASPDGAKGPGATFFFFLVHKFNSPSVRTVTSERSLSSSQKLIK